VAGVPKLKQAQNYCYNKRTGRVRRALGKVSITSNNDFMAIAMTYAMPRSLSLLQGAPSSALVNSVLPTSLWVPQQPAAYGMHGACFTGTMQIKWIGQLVNIPGAFSIHADGTYKYHHGGWILITLGTHHLRWYRDQQKLTNSFVPLIYLFCKEHESKGAGMMLCAAANAVAKQYYKEELQPGMTCTDHCAGAQP
jgi:hypothetical protein